MVIPTTTGTEGSTIQRGAPTAPADSTARTSLTTSGAMKHPSIFGRTATTPGTTATNALHSARDTKPMPQTTLTREAIPRNQSAASHH